MNTITAQRGTTTVRDISVYADASNTVELDITDNSMAFNAYTSPGGTLVTDLTDEVTVTDAANGKVRLAVTAGPTYGHHVYYYNFLMTDTDGYTFSIDSGKLIISEGIV